MITYTAFLTTPATTMAAFNCAPGAKIVSAIADEFGVTVRALCSERKSRPLPIARFAAAYLMRDFADYSYPRIGRVLGGRDHTTVMYGVRKCEKLMQDNPFYAAKVARVHAKITGGRIA